MSKEFRCPKDSRRDSRLDYPLGLIGKVIHGVDRAGEHLFPFRTEQLSPAPPMVLGSNPGE